MTNSPMCPVAMPIFMSIAIMPWRVSSKVSAREAKAGPSGWRSSKGGPTGRATFMRLMAVKRKACKWSDIMVGPARLLAKRSCATFVASRRCWCHQNLSREASAVCVSDAMGIS